MMRLSTDFSPLMESVKRIGIPLSEQARMMVKNLEDGIVIESKTEYISAPSGFFDLLPNGDVVRLILHLGSFHGVTQNGMELYDPDRWHKYHLTPCGSVSGAPPSRQLRYVKTQRRDGKFPYRVLNCFGDEVAPAQVESGRKLNLCGSCRNKVADRMGFFDFWSEFKLHEFISSYGSIAMRFNSDPIKFDEDTVYYFKWDDWREIANFAKHRSGWMCARCRRDCSRAAHRRFLHAHYREGIVGGALANVTPLCIVCHSREPGSHHRRLQSLPIYREFQTAFPDSK
jgi:hypothetical protein